MTYFKQNIDYKNTSTRLLITLACDGSGTMGEIVSGDYKSTGRIEYDDGKAWTIVEGGTSKSKELKDGFDAFIKNINNNEDIMYASEISVVEFASKVTPLTPGFVPAEELKAVQFHTQGNTVIGSGVLESLDRIEHQKTLLKKAGMQLYVPWLILMTDGVSYGEDPAIYEQAIARCRDLVNRNKLVVFPIAIGKEANIQELQRFSPKMKVLTLNQASQVKLKDFFNFLVSSASEIVSSNVRSDFLVKPWNELAEA